MTTVVEKTAGVVLAGGRSSRMGSPKAALDWHGSTLLRRTVSVVARAVTGPVLVVRAPGQQLPDLPPEVEVAADPREGLGPVAGHRGRAGGPVRPRRGRVRLLHRPALPAPGLHRRRARRARPRSSTWRCRSPAATPSRWPPPTAPASRRWWPRSSPADRLRPAFLFDQCRVRPPRRRHAAGRPGRRGAATPSSDSVVNVNEPQDYEQARSTPTARGHRPVLRRRGEPRGRRAPYGARSDAGPGRGRRVRPPGPATSSLRSTASRSPGTATCRSSPATRSRSSRRTPGGEPRCPAATSVERSSSSWTTAAPRVLELPEPVLRAYLGGSGLGTWLMHRLAPTGVDPLAPEAPLAFVFSPLVGHAAHHQREVRRRGQVPAHRDAQRRPRLQPLRDLGQADRVRRHRRARPLHHAVGPAGRRRRCAARRSAGRLGPAGRRGGAGSRRHAWAGAGGSPRSARPASAASATPRSPTTAATPAAAASARCWGPRTSRRSPSTPPPRSPRPTPRASSPPPGTCAHGRSGRPPPSTASSARWPTC